ncbi:MAG: S46 family peptidase [Kofleriaceae bacterium]
MKHAATAALLLAACGGSQAPNTTTSSGPGLAIQPSPEQPPPQDPAFVFRAGYANPGGMWLPSQMALPQHAQTFRDMGLDMPSSRLADPLEAPLAAVVKLNGCTGSFVSPEGLVVTNHHCVQSGLLYNSKEGEDLVENGFLARTRADEKSAGPSQRVMVAQAYRDVTAELRAGLDAMTDAAARKDALEAREKAMVAACEKDRPGIKCDVSSFFRGDSYQLIEYLELRDVRLVYVPHRAVGNYGGEVDNWAWPRHTGDFAFYRAYVGPDGAPADYAEANVPTSRPTTLTVSTEGLRPSDFVMVTGYPGRTERTVTASEVKHDVEWFYPYYVEYLQQRYDLAAALAKDGGGASTTAIKAGVTLQSIQNALEKNRGVLDGLRQGDLLARKDALDAQIKAWAALPGHEADKAKIERLEALLAADRATARVDLDRGIALGGSRLLATAIGLVRLADERTKPDAERKPGYQERDMPQRLAGQQSFLRSYDRTLDRATLRLALVRALALPAVDRPWLATIVGVKPTATIDEAVIDRALTRLYGAPLPPSPAPGEAAPTKPAKVPTVALEDEALRISLTKSATPKSLAKSKDPFIQIARALMPLILAEEAKSDALAGDLLVTAPAYVSAMRTVLGGMLAPDANSTLRITYGTVRSFNPGSPVEADWPFTLASQIPAKDTGADPFDAPKPLLAAVAAKRYGPYADPTLGGELPVNFLSDLDITGGNSGSPTLNARGELVGLAFDGTIAGVSSDVVFAGERTRTIQVDARYMLWVMDALDDADHLLVEMGLTPAL